MEIQESHEEYEDSLGSPKVIEELKSHEGAQESHGEVKGHLTCYKYTLMPQAKGLDFYILSLGFSILA